MTSDEFRAALKALGISQTKLGRVLGVDHNTVHRWTKGTLKVPQYASAYVELMLATRDVSPP